MKKILLLPLLLALIIFSLYHENVQNDVSHEVKKIEKVEVVNNSNEELSPYIEENESNETNETEEKRFSVKILGDLNTTKGTMLRLSSEVKNAKEIEKCNYFWYENKQLIALGAVLEESFLKGEHQITLVVRDSNGAETNDTVIVGAYNYYSTKRFHYDPYYGNLLYVENQILNNKGQYVLYDNGTYSKEYASYDDNNNLLEQTVEYYNNFNENRKTEYTYDDRGNRLTTQTFNADGESVYYILNVYDENETIISTKEGKSEDDLGEEIYSSTEVVYYPDPYATTDTETANEGVSVPKDIVRMNENEQVVYEERHYYGGYEDVNEMSYNEDGKLTKSVRRSTTPYGSRSDIIDYDKDGNAVKREIKYEAPDSVPCHYVNKSSYNSSGQRKSVVNTLLYGECPHIDEVKRTYSYNKDGRIASVKASSDGESASGLNSLVVVNTYTNELDI